MSVLSSAVPTPARSQRTVLAAAVGDRTPVIQTAIDQVSAVGGGCVSLGPGDHVIGGLRLKSGVELHLQAGAVLRPVPDYDTYADNRVRVIAENSDRAMLVASGAHDVALTGSGRIEGSGDAFIVGDDVEVGTFIPAQLRPRVLVIEDCRGVRLEGLTVVDSPMWTLHFVNCDDVTVRHVTVRNNLRMPNTDGLVLDACRQAVIEDCDIATADDGICLKTSIGPDGRAIGECREIVVRRNQIVSRSCALKVGTESHGDFTGIRFEDCQIRASNRGLGLFSRDGGRMTNIRFSRISVECQETPDGFWGSGEALTVTVVDRRPERPAGAITDLIVEDITGTMQGAVNLVALSASGLHHVTLRRIRLSQRPGPLGTGRSYDIRPTQADIAPSPDAHGRANAWTRGADGRVIGLQDYPGGMPALFADGVIGLTVEDFETDRPAALPNGWNEQEIVIRPR